MWALYERGGGKIKGGKPCQATVLSKIFHEISIYRKEIENYPLILSSIDDLTC
jgi:hypothetical protein